MFVRSLIIVQQSNKDVFECCAFFRYKQLAREWHPDKNLQQKDYAEQRFKEISEAHRVLSNGLFSGVIITAQYMFFKIIFLLMITVI